MTTEQGNVFKEYLKDAKLRGHTLQGVKNLRSGLPKYFEYLNEMELRFNQIRIKDAIGYQRWLIETGKKDKGKYANSTIAHFMNSATNFNNYLKRQKLIYSNPFLEVKKIRGDLKLSRNILKEKEVNMLLNELSLFNDCEGNLVSKITKYKAHVACELMYATGLRSSEASGLKDKDIDFEKGIVNVIEGKGGASRIALLNDYAKGILKLYITDMKEIVSNSWNRKNQTLFGMGWERFNKMVNEVLKKECRKLKLPAFTSHCFRHSLGYHLLRSGCDIRYIQAILGHKKLSSTEIYTKVDKEDLKEVLNKYHPRQFKDIKNERIDV